MGERNAPDMFLDVFGKPVMKWNQQCYHRDFPGRLLVAKLPNGKQCDISLTTFVDDIQKKHALDQAKTFSSKAIIKQCASLGIPNALASRAGRIMERAHWANIKLDAALHPSVRIQTK